MGESMLAVVFEEFGGPEVLRAAELPIPVPGPRDVLLRVRAVSVGRTLDLAARAGQLPFASSMPMPHVLGAEHVGEVVATGSEATAVRVGARVAAFPVHTCGECRSCQAGRQEACPGLTLVGVHRHGAYAEYCAVPESTVYEVPEEVTDEEACALALNGAVARRQLDTAGVEPGDWVFVQAAAGGLGSAVVALAVHRGVHVIAGARQDWQRERLRDMGVTLALDPASPGFAEEVNAVTGGGVQAVVDNLADPALWSQAYEVLAPGGTVVCSGALAAGRVEIDLRRMYVRNQSVRTVRTARPSDAEGVWKEIANGLRGVVDKHRFTITEAADAHRYLESGRNFGRVVLRVEH
jgi:NADPH:quinone reductase-like Zn-dependent oxidoreductase